MKLKNISIGPSLWYVAMPLVLALGYWIFLNTLDVDENWLRLTALPNPIFDWWFYLQILARDALTGTHTLFHGLALFAVPLMSVVSWLSTFLTWSEIYFFGLIASLVLSLWLFSELLRSSTGLDAGQARFRSFVIFLMAQSVIGFRPGAASWYVPCFLIALLALWSAEKAWEGGLTWRALTFDVVACFFALVYPWYFLFVATSVVLLFCLRFLKFKHVSIILGFGLIGAFAIFLTRDIWLHRITSTSSLDAIARGGIGFSHIPIVTNTLVVIFLWLAVWLAWFRWQSEGAESGSYKIKARILLVTWTALAILWLQNIFTGFSITSDHFIYSVWVLSALSWVVWSQLSSRLHDARRTRIFFLLGIVASVYAVSILYHVLLVFSLDSMGGEMIHLAIWGFTALALLSTPLSNRGQTLMLRIAPVIAVGLTVMGLVGIARFAWPQRTDVSEYLGLMHWTAAHVADKNITWCSDWNAEQVLAPNTGLKIFPSTVFLLDHVSNVDLQNRQIDFAAFFHALGSDQGWRVSRQILFSTDLLCDINQRARDVVGRMVKDDATRAFIIGCDPVAMDRERAVVIQRMEARWSSSLPETSNVCDRFIVRKSLNEYWRIPAAYSKLYSDDALTVYGKR